MALVLLDGQRRRVALFLEFCRDFEMMVEFETLVQNWQIVLGMSSKLHLIGNSFEINLVDFWRVLLVILRDI